MASRSDTCPLVGEDKPWPGFDSSTWLHVKTAWGPRIEHPQQIASRWLDLFPRLAKINPAFCDWWDWIDLDAIISLPAEIEVIKERIVKAADRATPEVARSITGYRLQASNTCQNEWGARNAFVDAFIGGGVDYIGRAARICTDFGIVPDPDVFNFRSLRAMLLVLAEVFDADCGAVERYDLASLAPNYEDGATHISPCWLAYVAPRFVALVTPPPTAIVEMRPDGGLLMAATTGQLDLGNPAHVRAAFDIAAGSRALRRFGR